MRKVFFWIFSPVFFLLCIFIIIYLYIKGEDFIESSTIIEEADE